MNNPENTESQEKDFAKEEKKEDKDDGNNKFKTSEDQRKRINTSSGESNDDFAG